MTKQAAAQLTKELFDKLARVKLGTPAGVFGTTSHQSMLANLMKSVGEFGVACKSAENHEVKIKRFELMMGQLDAAVIAGVISETEAADYYILADTIWTAIEQEKNIA